MYKYLLPILGMALMCLTGCSNPAQKVHEKIEKSEQLSAADYDVILDYLEEVSNDGAKTLAEMTQEYSKQAQKALMDNDWEKLAEIGEKFANNNFKSWQEKMAKKYPYASEFQSYIWRNGRDMSPEQQSRYTTVDQAMDEAKKEMEKAMSDGMKEAKKAVSSMGVEVEEDYASDIYVAPAPEIAD